MTMPTFFVVGAAKSGTTALHRALERHPEVFVPLQKETNFFALSGKKPAFQGPLDAETINRFSIWRRDDYERLFSSAGRHAAIGEVCPLYLYSDVAAQAIHDHVPDATIVIVLREPVSRAFSAYQHLVRDGRETHSFREAVAREPDRIAAHWEWFWHLTAVSTYSPQVERYLERFGRGNVRFFLHEELLDAPERVLGELADFLNIARHGFSRVEPQNVSGVPTRWASGLHGALYRPGPMNTALRRILPARLRKRWSEGFKGVALERASVDTDVASDLAERFAPDVQRLERMTGLDLARWKEAWRT